MKAKSAKKGCFSPNFGLFSIGCISETDCAILLKLGMLMDICNALELVLFDIHDFNFRQNWAIFSSNFGLLHILGYT